MSNNVIGTNIRKLREKSGLTQPQIADKVNVSKQSISNWETGLKAPRMGALQKLADIFGVSIGDITDEHPVEKSVPEQINRIISKLTTDRQQVVYDCAEEQLNEQNHPTVRDIDDYRPTNEVKVLGTVSAGTGEWLDEQAKETVTIEGPIPHYDFAVRVNGNSMTPTFSDGEILFVDKVESASDVRNNQFVIAEINGNAYVKKLFVSNEGVRLISLNKDYEDIIIHDYDDYRIVGTVVI